MCEVMCPLIQQNNFNVRASSPDCVGHMLRLNAFIAFVMSTLCPSSIFFLVSTAKLWYSVKRLYAFFSAYAMIILIQSELMNTYTGCLTICRHLWTLHEGCKVYHISCQLQFKKRNRCKICVCIISVIIRIFLCTFCFSVYNVLRWVLHIVL